MLESYRASSYACTELPSAGDRIHPVTRCRHVSSSIVDRDEHPVADGLRRVVFSRQLGPRVLVVGDGGGDELRRRREGSDTTQPLAG